VTVNHNHKPQQLPELTLALHHASDKLTLAKDALRKRTAQFVDVQVLPLAHTMYCIAFVRLPMHKRMKPSLAFVATSNLLEQRTNGDETKGVPCTGPGYNEEVEFDLKLLVTYPRAGIGS
jgi:hypothetical protein